MRLAKLTEFRRLVYTPDSAPSVETLRRRIDRCQIPGGRKEGSRYWVDLDVFDSVTHFRAGLETKRRQLAAHPALEGLIS